MRISDWSSDVCSSDLLTDGEAAYILSDCAASVLLTSPEHLPLIEKLAGQLPGLHVLICDPLGSGAFSDMSGTTPAAVDYAPVEGQMLAYSSGTSGKPIGRASCRERVCQYVYISVVAVSL